jgi:hypothetical protein
VELNPVNAVTLIFRKQVNKYLTFKAEVIRNVFKHTTLNHAVVMDNDVCAVRVIACIKFNKPRNRVVCKQPVAHGVALHERRNNHIVAVLYVDVDNLCSRRTYGSKLRSRAVAGDNLIIRVPYFNIAVIKFAACLHFEQTAGHQAACACNGSRLISLNRVQLTTAPTCNRNSVLRIRNRRVLKLVEP